MDASTTYFFMRISSPKKVNEKLTPEPGDDLRRIAFGQIDILSQVSAEIILLPRINLVFTSV